MTDLAENTGIRPFVQQSIWRTLFDAEPAPWSAAGEWTEELLDWSEPGDQEHARKFMPNPGWTWLQGEQAVEGHVLGGNVEVLEFIKGTRWWPGHQLWKGAVLLLETSEEVPAPQAVDRFVRNYGHQEILQSTTALLLTRPNVLYG